MTITAWYMDDSDEDQRSLHKIEGDCAVPIDKLSALGVLSWQGINGEGKHTVYIW